jgi:peroxiredoxin
MKAPDFCLEGLNGKKLQLHSLRGNVILLNFWATWCGPCREEMPSMEALYQQYKDRDFMLLTISVDEGSPEPIRKFIQKNDYHFPVLFNPTGKTLDLFGIDRIPATLLIDKKGRILGRAIGPRDWSHPDVFSFIDRLLDDRPIRAVSLRK